MSACAVEHPNAGAPRPDPCQHLNLVRAVARRYVRQARDFGLDPDDLLSEGILGLARACDRFDPARGLKFSTIALKLIERSIQEALRRHRWPLPGQLPLLEGGDGELVELDLANYRDAVEGRVHCVRSCP
jgi:hypothetical protein